MIYLHVILVLTSHLVEKRANHLALHECSKSILRSLVLSFLAHLSRMLKVASWRAPVRPCTLSNIKNMFL